MYLLLQRINLLLLLYWLFLHGTAGKKGLFWLSHLCTDDDVPTDRMGSVRYCSRSVRTFNILDLPALENTDKQSLRSCCLYTSKVSIKHFFQATFNSNSWQLLAVFEVSQVSAAFSIIGAAEACFLSLLGQDVTKPSSPRASSDSRTGKISESQVQCTWGCLSSHWS